MKDLTFVGLKYSPQNDAIYANTHSGKTEKMEWIRDTRLRLVEEWMKKFQGVIGETSRSPLMSAKKITYHNGLPYLGLLTSLIWGNKSIGYVTAERTLKFGKGSLLDLMHKEYSYIREKCDQANASSLCYEMLSNLMWVERFVRKSKISRGHGPEDELYLGFSLTWKEGKIEGGVSQDTDFYLVPSNSKEPTPKAVPSDKMRYMVNGEPPRAGDFSWFARLFRGKVDTAKRDEATRLRKARRAAREAAGDNKRSWVWESETITLHK